MSIKAFYSVLQKDETLPVILADCAQAFTCRNISSKSENYSVGSTYFLKGSDTPKCNLEVLAQQIFKHHTKGIEFDPKTSGSEWWTQVIDSRDDIGFHWDRDYGREEYDGVHVYPNFATVTYLSDAGGPTLVLDKVGTPESSEQFVGQVERFSASKPILGKHIAFNGNLLHAAPSDLTEDDSDEGSGESSGSDDGDAADPDAVNRITFLVNIWINHIPKQCKRFPAKQLTEFQPVNKKIKMTFTNDKPASANTTVQLSADNCTRAKIWKFNNSDVNYEVVVPLPDVDATKATIEAHDIIDYVYDNPANSEDPHSIQIIYAEDDEMSFGDSDGSGSGEEGSGSELEEESEPEKEAPKAKRRKA